MEEWKEYKEYKISDIATMKNGKKRPNSAGDYPVFGGNGIMDYVNCYNAENVIIVGRVGAYCGNVFYSKEKCWISDNAIAVFANEVVDIEYLYYKMTSIDLHHNHIGGAQPLMTQDIIGGFDVLIPNMTTQKSAVSILNSLNDKIELNKRINDNLEQQAQALYKSWFVDFEPFKDGNFVESELGMIPEGWKVVRLEEICDIVAGGTPSKTHPDYYCENGIAWITPKDLSISNEKFTSHGETDITKLGYSKSSAKLMPEGSVLFSSRAPIGYISIATNDICTNQGFKSLVPKSAGTCFLYCYLKEETTSIENQATGSTFKEVSGSLMKNQLVIFPENSTIMQKFEQSVIALFKFQKNNEAENRNLMKYRDSLLPRLMSGELTINEMNN